MKNLFFALAFMLIGTFAFANNAKEVTTLSFEDSFELINSIESESSTDAKFINNLEAFGTCYITIGFYDADGNKVYELTLQIEGVSSAEECNEIANNL